MKKRTIYRIMGAIFLLILILPNFGILREKRNRVIIPKFENRFIAEKPTAPFFSKQYFKQWEKWYDDRILGRKDFILAWSRLNGRLFHILISEQVKLGKDNYLFMPFYLRSEIMEQDKKIAMLKMIQKKSEEAGAKFIVFIAPHSEWMMGELLPKNYTPVDIEKVERTAEELFRKNNLDYCSVAGDLNKLSIEERKTLYFPGDYHWNKKAAYPGSKKLLKQLNLDDRINNISFSYKEKDYGDIYTKKIGWEKIYSIVDVPWNEDFVADEELSKKMYMDGKYQSEENDVRKGELILINPKAKKHTTMLVLGDSFFIAMRPYMTQDIEKIIYTNNMSISNPRTEIDFEAMLERYHPDVVVYEKMAGFFYGESYDSLFKNWKKFSKS